MKKKFFFAAVALVALASCSTDEFIGENTNSPDSSNSGAIVFGLGVNGATRADMYGSEAATKLGNHFYVTGTKGTEAATSPTPNLVFDNYLVHYGINTAGTTTSNTANWDYVGVTPGTAPYADYVKLATTAQVQSIKYWDYSVEQYDFLAFSTGTMKAVSGSSTATDNVGVTAMKYGTNLASSGVAYTFDIPSAEAIKNVYISDITEVKKENYGKEVQLRFKNLGSKVRIALYETVPGYSVKDVNFYAVDGTNTDLETATKTTTATLISADANGIPTKGKIDVYFPSVGNNNASKADYNKAAATVTPATGVGSAEKSPTFGTLTNYAGKESYEEDATQYLGRTLPDATFAGSADADYYQTVFPVSSSSALTLRVDYTLVSTDGSGEEINVYGAKAVVPATYTKWLPNYAYTYIFKISDNSNGWTSTVTTDRAGLFPITFDAIVAEATDATGEQKTVTTVATPSITTYQQNHDITKDEYSIATGKDIYVQVMENSTATSSLVTTLSATNALFYAVSDADATEAKVMDALEKRTTDIGANDVTGRNSITLTKNANIDASVTSIENGADDRPITVTAGEAAKITISGLSAGTYAFVYDYTTGTKTTVMEYQPIEVTTGSAIGTGSNYASITTTALEAVTDVTTAGEAVDNTCIYFSKTTSGTGTTTYSYVSVAGKATLPAGLLKVAKNSLTTGVPGTTTAVDGTIYFDTYITNNGKYAVKVIKIVA